MAIFPALQKLTHMCPRKHILGQKWPFLAKQKLWHQHTSDTEFCDGRTFSIIQSVLFLIFGFPKSYTEQCKICTNNDKKEPKTKTTFKGYFFTKIRLTMLNLLNENM